MDVTQTHKRNAAWWNETAEWYGEGGEAEDIAFLRTGASFLFEAERQLLGDLHPWCKRAIHLQSSHGRDALSLLNQGAAEVIGVDISERLLTVAEHKSDALEARARWVHADILETPHEFDGTADLVYTGKGAICWMMNLAAWAQVVARLLAPGGLFFIYEAHPLDWVWDSDASEYVLDRDNGVYFSQKPRRRLFARVTQTDPEYRNWTLGEVVNSLIVAGLAIESLHEFPEPFWDQFQNMSKETLHRLPHTFALRARKR